MQIEVYSPTIRRKEMDAVLTAMVEDKIGPGDQAKFLIQTAKEKIGFDFCLALRSPAIALSLALKALNLKQGQGVIISALSPLYYRRVIEDSGLIALYCDVLPSTCCMARETVEKLISSIAEGPGIGCIVIHHTLGFLGDGAAIAELGFPVIEDCSQSYGSMILAGSGGFSAVESKDRGEEPSGIDVEGAVKGIPSGNAGVFTILGLEERDMLTSGGGALLYSVSRRDAAALRELGDLPPEYGLPDMNAALAVVQFREALRNIQKRGEIARLYTQSSLRTRHKRFVQHDVGYPKNQADRSVAAEGSAKLPVEYNNYAFPLILETGMKDVRAYARRKDIAVESAFENTLAGKGLVLHEQCPESYSLSLRTVLFPLYPRLGMTNAEKVAKLILTLP